jgi:hypothetical protein
MKTKTGSRGTENCSTTVEGNTRDMTKCAARSISTEHPMQKVVLQVKFVRLPSTIQFFVCPGNMFISTLHLFYFCSHVCRVVAVMGWTDDSLDNVRWIALFRYSFVLLLLSCYVDWWQLWDELKIRLTMKDESC